MGRETGIQWCHHTWSPWRGCAKVSPGCKFCFAEALSHRNPAVLGEWGPNGVRVVNADWGAPLRWDRSAAKAGERRRVFPSLCDWLEDRPELIEPRARFLALIAATPNLDWLLLTKRPENFDRLVGVAARSLASRWADGDPPANVWYGVSAEDQEHADARIPILLDTPAAVRWVSYEPALGPVDFEPFLAELVMVASRPALDWIVVGGESGAKSKARPFDLEWARSTVGQCRDHGVPVYVKQLGTNPYESGMALKRPPGHEDGDMYFQPHRWPFDLAHKKGGDPSEWPDDLRVQEYPTISRERTVA